MIEHYQARRHNVLNLEAQREVSLPKLVFTALIFLVTRQ